MPPMVETHLANTVLTNGARFYVDHAHPEYSSPECRDAARGAALRPGRRGGRCAGRWRRPGALSHDGPQLVVYKNNSDGKGNSYGCHENYLHGPRRCPSAEVVRGHRPPLRHPPALLRARARSGAETAVLDAARVDFQLSQRAEFFEEQVGLETTLKRPIVNTRDEPHADPHRYRRLHVIVGDANLSEVATFLKLGTTALRAGHDRGRRALSRRASALADPVAGHPLGRRRPRRSPGRCPGRRRRRPRALEIQWELFGAARKYADDRGLECLGRRGRRPRTVLERWEHGARRARDRPDVAGPTGRLGGQAAAPRGLPGPPRPAAGTTPGWPPWTCSTTTCGPSRSLFARLDTRDAGRRRRRWPPP